MPDTARIAQAYAHCQRVACNHYENFPVASRLLPQPLRRPISAVYAFARNADDFADEGNASPQQRLALLDDYARALEQAAQGQANDDPVFIALADVLQTHALAPSLHDLLTAFRMDVTTRRYPTAADVLAYCHYSAKPVGRMVLQLCGRDDSANLACSDAICTALQLINFLQDIDSDYRDRQRIYLPLDEMQRFEVTEAQLAARHNSPQLRALIHYQIARAHDLMKQGAPLGARLTGMLGLEIRLTIAGGMRILEALRRRQDSFSQPRLRPRDWPIMAWQALIA